MALDLLSASRVAGPRARESSRLWAAMRPWSLGLVALLAWVPYWPHLRDFFTLDDYIWLREARNPDFGAFLLRAVSFPDATVAATPTPFWRPLIDVYFYGAWRLFGLSPLPYHLVNVALHAIVAVLAARLAWKLSRSLAVGLTAGALFAVHPAYDFAVLWISDITELLGAVFSLAALLSYAAYLGKGVNARRWYAAALTALALGLLSKESTATLPLVLALLTFTVSPPGSVRALAAQVAALLPFVLLAGAYAAFLLVGEYGTSEAAGIYQFDHHALLHVWEYLQRLAIPFRDTDPAFDLPRQALAAAFLVLGAGSVALRRRAPAFAFAWTLVALLPYSFFMEGIEYRYTYPAAIPFTAFWVLLGSAGVAWLLRRGVQPALVAAGAAAGVAMLAVLLAQETRERQAWLGGQAAAYSAMFHQAPALCGPLEPGSAIYLLNDPVWDYFGVSSGIALSFSYEDVAVYRNREPVEEMGQRTACVLRYEGGGYRPVDGP